MAIEPTLKQMVDIIGFLITHDYNAFDESAVALYEELVRCIEDKNKLEERLLGLNVNVRLEPTMREAVLIIETLLDKLQHMWCSHHAGDKAHQILDYIKRITCEISLVRSNMIHPDKIGDRDFCIFDIDDTLLHSMDCLPLCRGVIPEMIAWMLELQAKGYSIILLTARTHPHPDAESQLALHGIVVHKYLCAPASTYSPYDSVHTAYQRAKVWKQRARLQMIMDGYNIRLTVGNLVIDVDDNTNRYLLPVRCIPLPPSRALLKQTALL